MPEGSSTPPARGSTIGRFFVLGPLGAGGMGIVLSAYDPELNRKVAIKLVHPGRGDVVVEAQAMARLRHPNVIAVHEIGPGFVVMEHVDGGTLRGWLDERERTWREILDMFVAAGDGLAAAHREGIVHRDFKPANVLVDEDGRARVADFGLVAAQPRAGTLVYMAPEQRRGDPSDARADQFAFCVSLWEALEGERPAAGATPPRSRRAPRWIYRALARGLRVDPAERWPALADLLGALRRKRSRNLLLVAVGGAAALGTAAFLVGRQQSSAPLCADAAALVAPVWDQTARARVEGAFRATGRPYAEATFARVDGILRGRLASWAAGHDDACAATHVRHEQSEALLDARMLCLAQARRELAALTSSLAEADAAALDRAVLAAGSVGDVAPCADVATLREVAPPPRDPVAAEQVGKLQLELARVTALRYLGDLKHGRGAAQALVEQADAVGHAPTLAKALDLSAWFESGAGSDQVAVAALYRSTEAAAVAHDDAQVANSFSFLEHVLGYGLHEFGAAEVAYRSALAAAARAGNPARVLERVYAHHTDVQSTRRDYLPELPLNLLVLALNAALYGGESFQVARALDDIATTAGHLGHAGDVRGLHERAQAIAERALGAEHPQVLGIINNRAMNLLAVRDLDAAASLYERALAAKERVYGPDAPSVAISLHNLGMVRLDQLRLGEARAALERAVAIRVAKLGPKHTLLATTWDLLAHVADLEGRTDEALADFDRALAIYREANGATDSTVADVDRAKAEVLLDRGRREEARAAVAEAAAIDARGPAHDRADPAATLRLKGLLLVADGRPREAIALYEQAIALDERKTGGDPYELTRALTDLAAALVDSGGDAERAVAAGQRAVAEGTAGHQQADVLAAARFQLARARWSAGKQAEALAEARAARATLAALPFPAADLPRIDRWLASRKR